MILVSDINIDTFHGWPDKAEVIQAMKTFYCRVFSEDIFEGSEFDCAVLDALDKVRDEYASPRIGR